MYGGGWGLGKSELQRHPQRGHTTGSKEGVVQGDLGGVPDPVGLAANEGQRSQAER